MRVEWEGAHFRLGLTVDVCRSTFEFWWEKQILHFRSQWPWPFSFKPQICSPTL